MNKNKVQMKEENSWRVRPWTKPNFDAPTPPSHVGLDMCQFKMHHHMWKASKYVKGFSNEKFSKADEPKCKKNCLFFITTWRNFSRPQRCCNFLSKKSWSLWCHFPMIDETNNSSEEKCSSNFWQNQFETRTKKKICKICVKN